MIKLSRIKVYILFLLMTLSTYGLKGQYMEVSAGVVANSFFSPTAQYPNDRAVYSSNSSGYIHLSVFLKASKSLNIGFSLGYESIGGYLDGYAGGMIDGWSVKANVQKSLLTIGFYPIHKTFFNRFNVGLGMVYSKLMEEQFSGIYRTYSNFNPSSSSMEVLEQKYERFSSNNNFGIKGMTAYDFQIMEGFDLSLQYFFYLGFTNEFRHFTRFTKSRRHYFGLGLKRQI